jgi:hypothetical protein
MASDERYGAWPWDRAKAIMLLPMTEWKAEIDKAPEPYREMIRTHLRCYVDRQRCKKTIGSTATKKR